MINLLIILGKVVEFFSKKLKLGSGSTWPGHLALFFDKDFVKKVLKKNPHLKIIIVAGTNGKTTTVSLIKHILKKLNYKVFSNNEGANLLNGVASALIKNSFINGKIDYDYAVFEADEFFLPVILKEIIPESLIILNLFRDQLDRYGEVNTIAKKWLYALKTINNKTNFFINGDDPQLYAFGRHLSRVFFFGIDQKLMKKNFLKNDIDSIFCPLCFQVLEYEKISYSHLGKFSCQKCGFRNDKVFRIDKEKISYPLLGLYNVYNINGVYLFFEKIFSLEFFKFNQLIKDFSPSFGRQEKIVYQKRKFLFFLAKNPAGFNQNLETIYFLLKKQKGKFFVILNNRIPDGRDVSWIWDIDFSIIKNKADFFVVAGDRGFDMAVRLKYEFFSKIEVYENLFEAIKRIIFLTKEDDLIIVLPTYSAMIDLRKILTGKKYE